MQENWKNVGNLGKNERKKKAIGENLGESQEKIGKSWNCRNVVYLQKNQSAAMPVPGIHNNCEMLGKDLNNILHTM